MMNCIRPFWKFVGKQTKGWTSICCKTNFILFGTWLQRFDPLQPLKACFPVEKCEEFVLILCLSADFLFCFLPLHFPSLHFGSDLVCVCVCLYVWSEGVACLWRLDWIRLSCSPSIHRLGWCLIENIFAVHFWLMCETILNCCIFLILYTLGSIWLYVFPLYISRKKF